MLAILRSLQWRLVFILISITIALMTFVYVILNQQVESYYYLYKFKNSIDQGLDEWGIGDSPGESEIIKYLKDDKYAMELFSTSENKPYTIYSKEKGAVIYTSDVNYDLADTQQKQKLETEIQKSMNFISALAGKTGDNDKLTSNNFFDYAIAKGDYILYFRYYRDEWLPIIRNFDQIIFSSSFFAIIVSLIIGYILSKTITVPISNITNNAQKIAAGEFDQVLPVVSDDEIGKLTRTFNYMATSLKDTLTEISSEKNKIETILNYMTDGVIAFDILGGVIHINPAAKKMLDIKELTFHFNDFSQEYNMGIELEEILYLESSGSKERDIHINEKFIRAYFAIFTDENRKAEGVIAVLHDITAQQRLEDMRKEFVANVSHELRTPLTSIKSYAETLLDGALSDKETAERFLSVINSEADRMTRLVKDLLQLSRLDNQQMKWNMKSMSFTDLVKNTVEKMQLESTGKGQKLECFTIGELPEIVADRDRIEQVILNIVSNAIKYTPEGGNITVYLGRTYSEVYAKVADNGIGIPAGDLPRIFERFYRVDKARSREMGGTGLGLSIAKEIVEAHGGTIAISSEPEKGTEVTVRLPIVMAEGNGQKAVNC